MVTSNIMFAVGGGEKGLFQSHQMDSSDLQNMF
jgi:hypothetical protein